MRLSTRLTVAMVAIATLTTVMVGFFTYRTVETVAIPRALDRIGTRALVNATELEATMRGLRGAANAFRSAPVLDAIVRASEAGGTHPDGTPLSQLRGLLARRFVAELTANTDYSQFRLVAADGREMVKVGRTQPGEVIRIFPDAELHHESGSDYFARALRVSATGAVDISPVELKRERGEVVTPHAPVIRAGAPVLSSDGKRFGTVIIEVDLQRPFARIEARRQAGGQIYIVNEQGDYLLHPDPKQAFGFELGNPIRMQDEFPDIADAVNSAATESLIVQNRAGERFGAGLASVLLADGPRVTVIETLPYARVTSTLTASRNSTILAGLMAIAAAIALSLVVSRSLTRPLVQMTHAVENFARDDKVVVPVMAGGEIGLLAKAFADMAAELREKASALRQENEERRRIFETSLDLILVVDRKGNFIRVSPSSVTILGYHPDELVGRSAVDFIYPGDLESTRAEMRAARHGQVICNFQSRYVHKDGRVVTLAWTGVWSEPEQKHFFIGRDMTEQQLAQDELKKTREFLDIIVENVPLTITVKDARNFRYALINRAGEAFFGRPREQIVGKSVHEIFPKDIADAVTERDLRVLASGGETAFGERALLESGTRFVDTRKIIIPDSDGRPRYLLGVVEDVTERKKTQEALLESAQMARSIIDTALDAFVQMDEGGTITDWNAQAETIFGWSREDAIGKTLSSLIIPPAYRERHTAGLAHFLRTGEGAILGKRFEIDALRSDGKELKVELAVTALRLSSGYVFNGFINDLTEKIAAEEQFRQAQKMEAVGQLTGGIAHDFNNMLTVITGTIEILADAVADKPQLAAIANLIGEAADRGAELTGHLLAFARKQPLQPVETDINALIAGSLKLLRPTLGEQIEIESKCAADAWPALVDPTQLTSAILNLAVNARDAMPNGGKLTIETKNVVLDESYVRSNADVLPGSYVMIAVSDTGTGIPEAVREKVFEPFFSTKEVGKGTGLGLSMVYGFVKQSGGNIKIYSEEGYGTTFRIYFPRAHVSSETSSVVAASPHAERGGETILVVEDDALVRSYVTTQLQTLGYVTLAAANATEALAIVDSGAAFDLLFTDIIMPGGMNGRELADKIARRRAPLRVLFTSGYTENAIVHHGRLDPGVLLLAKPYRRSDLARMIRTALSAAGVLSDKEPGRKAKVG